MTAGARGVAAPAAVTGTRVAMRRALIDFAFHPWEAIAANAAWGILLIVLLSLALMAPGLAILLAPLLAVPTAGSYRVAALIVREEPVSAWDGLRLPRRTVGLALLLGIGSTAAVGMLVVNVASGFAGNAGPVGWAIATGAAWGLVGGWVWLLYLWPLVVDPRRAHRPLRDRARLAALLVLARPGKAAALVAVTSAVLLAATVLFAALIMLAVSFCALLGCRVVLPLADALETGARPATPGTAAQA